MKQVSMRQLHRASADQIRGWVPFEILSDGEVVGKVTLGDMVPAPNNLRRLAQPFSKQAQMGKAPQPQKAAACSEADW